MNRDSMLNVNKCALILPIERNKKILQNNNKYLNCYYEYEAIRCIKSWRTNAGRLNNIPIYTFCFANKDISLKTKNELQKYNVQHIFLPNLKVYNSNILFISIPYTGHFFSNLFKDKYDFLIRIDLDMIIVKEFPVTLIEKAKEYDAVIGYDDTIEKNDFQKNRTRKTYANCPVFDTGLVITKTTSKFYDVFFYYCLSENQSEVFLTDLWKENEKWIGIDGANFYKEEFIVDYINNKKICKIYPIGVSFYEQSHMNSKKNAFIKHSHLTLSSKLFFNDKNIQ